MGDHSCEEEFKAIVKAIEDNPPRQHRMVLPPEVELQAKSTTEALSTISEAQVRTPQGTQNPEPPGSGAPLLPHNFERILLVPEPATTPTPV